MPCSKADTRWGDNVQKSVRQVPKMDDQNANRKLLCRVCSFANEVRDQSENIRCSGCGIRLGVDDQSPQAVKAWRNKWLMRAGKVAEEKN
jgi:ribosomal protein L37AE/L43A